MHPNRLASMAASFSLIIPVAVAMGMTRVVPTQFPRIQNAIWASSGGDTVLVLPGTYVENIVIDRPVVVRSAQGPQVTVIDGSSPANPDSASVVTMLSGTQTETLEGFDIRTGSGTFHAGFNERKGGGILADSSVVVRGNWIHSNTLTSVRGVGGGIHAEFGVVTVAGNRIFDNHIVSQVHGYAGGLFAFGGAADVALIDGNEVYDNHVTGGTCGGIYTNGSIHNNVIACNSVDGVAGASASSAVTVITNTMEGNTIAANSSVASRPAVYVFVLRYRSASVFRNNVAYNFGSGVECAIDQNQGDLFVECNNIYGNTEGAAIGDCAGVIGQDGNISVEPAFGRGSCPFEFGDWCLGPNSPLLPENSPPGCGLIGARGECPPIAVPEVDAPAGGRLEARFAQPNPFTERTAIGFYLGAGAEVEVEIYGVLGRKVRTLRAGRLGGGEHVLDWDGRGEDGARAASGGYVAVIRAGREEVTRVLLLIR